LRVRDKLILCIAAVALTPLTSLGVFSVLNAIYFAPLASYFLSITIFIYVHHLLIQSGLFFKIGLPILKHFQASEMFRYFIKSSFLWMAFLPISRLLGDLTMWSITGEYYDIYTVDYLAYIGLLMSIGFGAGMFFSFLYALVARILISRRFKHR